MKSNIQETTDSFQKRLLQRLDSKRTGKSESIWSQDPVNLEEFLASEDHMNFSHITDRQKAGLLALLGNDPKKMFIERRYRIAALMLGKGSGKDLMASIAVCYVVYVLLCLKNPREYLFGKDIPGEPIDILNVAPSAELAELVFFEKLKQRVLNWKWLRRNYRLRRSGKDLDEKKKITLEDAVIIHPRDILFPKSVRCFSRHGDANLSEGFNVICFIMDEASRCPNPDHVFEILETSAKSRFPRSYRGFLLSYCTGPVDFMIRTIAKAINDPEIYTMIGATWEILPSWKYSGKKFLFDGKEIPIEFSADFQKNPEKALMMYACIPPKVSGDRFYKLPDKIDSCVDLNRPPIAEYEEIRIKAATGHERVGKKLLRYNIPRQPDSIRYFAKIDNGLNKDRGVVVVGHLTPSGVCVIDLILEWIPNYEGNLSVDFENVTDTIVDLKKNLCNIVNVTSDHWQSAQMIQKFQNEGINAEAIRGGKAPMETAKGAFYSNRVNMLNHTKTLHQLKALVDYGGHVDVDPKEEELEGHDDCAVGVSGLIHDMIGPKKSNLGPAMNDGYVVTSNLSDGSFSGLGTSVSLS